MSPRRQGPAGAGPTLTVCRGCCCGSVGKHPGTDHDSQLATLRAAGTRVRVTDCLDACEHSNVVVVSPSSDGRRAGARPVWLSGVLREDDTEAVGAWVRAGGPGVVAPPGMLDLLTFTPSRRQRRELADD
ncbi:hypothetical protein [Pseudonocardia sp.]|uniref:hypothetical protein n=1 Tax=Pseudonocardia sp. TaxID=60912 RepID=UPI003D0E3218